MINIESPNTYEAERRYIFGVIFDEFLGLKINIDFTNRQNILIKLDGNRQIVIPDRLFATPLDDWLKVGSLPQQPGCPGSRRLGGRDGGRFARPVRRSVCRSRQTWGTPG